METPRKYEFKVRDTEERLKQCIPAHTAAEVQFVVDADAAIPGWLQQYVGQHPGWGEVKLYVLSNNTDLYFGPGDCWLLRLEKNDTELASGDGEVTDEMSVPITLAVHSHGNKLAGQARCHDPAAFSYFIATLRAMGKIWREAQQALAEQGLADSSLSPATQHSNDKEKSLAPWERIPDVGWNRLAVKMWTAGHPASSIARRVGRSQKTVLNRLSDLRSMYGPEVVPPHRSS